NSVARISGVSASALHLNSTSATHPMDPLSPYFNNVSEAYCAGIVGTGAIAALNGVDTATTSNGQGGTSGAWTIPLASNPTGTYTSGGLVVPGATSRFYHSDRIAAWLAANDGSGYGFAITEFGPTQISAPFGISTTQSYLDVVQAMEANGLPYTFWAM